MTPVNSSHGLIVDFSPPPDCSNVCLIVDDNGVAGCMPYEATVVEGEGTSRLIVSYEDKVSSENYNPSYVTVVCGSSDFTQPTSSLTATSRPTPTLTHSDRLTIVLTLTLKDFSRATLLLTTLNKYTRSVPFSELIVVVPNSQQSVFEVVLFDLPYSKFSSRVVGEEELFEGSFNQSWNKYALQMAIKLKVSKIVTTEFYVTLDADVLVANNLVVSDFVDNDRRGNYVQEARSVHPRWWEGSKRILKIEEHSDLDDPTNGIGVTPAVMSTAGSMLVLGRMKQIHKLQLYEENWLSSFDTVWWSEYTMYRLTLNFFGVFEHLHSAFEGVKLSCFNVWWEGDLPWDPEPLFGRSGAAAQVCDDEVKDEVKDKCLFTVLQSTSGIEPSDIAKQLYDLKVI
ncbi:hypothetical protein TL16_g00428 [Triparma laevis f. inornata]|uniref:Uncharacterized protein n=1 Tax=Triparma laevis f. inornata TaxID=1714386 RepID=A0A9W6ZB56_9STRA|nr:hypothetical protein TL16_g00428 [Triparma laevis f. inornata]